MSIDTMQQRLDFIGQEDTEREQTLGGRCPSTLHVFLVSGLVLDNVELVDGVNSVDGASIDLRKRLGQIPGEEIHWIVAISQIAAIRQIYPSEEAEAAVRDKARH